MRHIAASAAAAPARVFVALRCPFSRTFLALLSIRPSFSAECRGNLSNSSKTLLPHTTAVQPSINLIIELRSSLPSINMLPLIAHLWLLVAFLLAAFSSLGLSLSPRLPPLAAWRSLQTCRTTLLCLCRLLRARLSILHWSEHNQAEMWLTGQDLDCLR